MFSLFCTIYSTLTKLLNVSAGVTIILPSVCVSSNLCSWYWDLTHSLIITLGGSSNKCLNVSRHFIFLLVIFLRCALSPAVSLRLTRAVFQWRCDSDVTLCPRWVVSNRAKRTVFSVYYGVQRHGAGTRAGNCESCFVGWWALIRILALYVGYVWKS